MSSVRAEFPGSVLLSALLCSALLCSAVESRAYRDQTNSYASVTANAHLVQLGVSAKKSAAGKGDKKRMSLTRRRESAANAAAPGGGLDNSFKKGNIFGDDSGVNLKGRGKGDTSTGLALDVIARSKTTRRAQ